MAATQEMNAPSNVGQKDNKEGQGLVNVGKNERLISAAAGALFCLAALSQMRPRVLIMGALGGALVYRGLTGHCDLYQQMGISTEACCDQ